MNGFNVGDGGDFRCYPSYPKSWDSTEMGWLARSFQVPAAWKGRRIFLRFDAVAGDAVVEVNGHAVAHNFDLFLPFEADITDAVKPGENELLVGVRKASLFDDRRTVGGRPYPAGSMWGQWIAGIWQDVTLESVPCVHVTDSYVQPHVSKGTLDVDVTVRNDSGVAKTVEVGGVVRPWVNLAGKAVLDAPEPRWKLGGVVLRLALRRVVVPSGRSVTVTVSARASGRLGLWWPDNPRLYGLETTLREGKAAVDTKYTRFGWREYAIRGSRLLLNGKPIELRGDSWHFMGIPQMTRRYAWAWFGALKEAHGNAVRLHAEPYPSFYLDMADEMGVCMLDETAIWGSDAGHKYDSPEFWQRCDDEVGRLVLRDRNHPSVFGWSVSNELEWWANQHKRTDIKDRIDEGWRGWLGICRRLDPTRPWVSTDGDGDADGIMPTSMMHYANPDHIARADKPYGEGESGGAYYGTPKYAAKFAGPRAYESQEGRMEGIAIEAYGLIAAQRRAGASYVSVFNLAWYGLQPLRIGLDDASRPYTLDDGVFFRPYREDQPGVQPERLGPYCTTFNPGYDPGLPLYRKWPLAEAIAAANAPKGAAPSTWAHAIDPVRPAVDAPAPAIDDVVVVAGAASTLSAGLDQIGVTTTALSSVGSKTPQLVIVDGAALPSSSDLDAIGRQIADWVAHGATCLVVDPQDSTVDDVNRILPKSIVLTDRETSSLVIDRADRLVDGMDDGDLYFTETLPGPVIRHGLSGPFVDRGAVIAEACAADWRRWNGRPEAQKTAAILRSEREAKPAGAALVSLAAGEGRYVVTTLDPASGNKDIFKFFGRMLANEGVVFAEPAK